MGLKVGIRGWVALLLLGPLARSAAFDVCLLLLPVRLDLPPASSAGRVGHCRTVVTPVWQGAALPAPAAYTRSGFGGHGTPYYHSTAGSLCFSRGAIMIL